MSGADGIGDSGIVFSNKNKIVFIIGLFSLLIILILAVITKGSYNISIMTVYQVVLAKMNITAQPNNMFNTIVWEIRIPRILVSIAVGMALATAGAVYQGTFRNPLVEPFVLGVSAGAAFGAALAIVFQGYLPIQLSAFVFGIISVGLNRYRGG